MMENKNRNKNWKSISRRLLAAGLSLSLLLQPVAAGNAADNTQLGLNRLATDNTQSGSNRLAEVKRVSAATVSGAFGKTATNAALTTEAPGVAPVHSASSMPSASSASSTTSTPSAVATQAPSDSEVAPLTILFANKSIQQFNRKNTKLLLQTEYFKMKLGEEDAAKYPALQKGLLRGSRQIKKAMKGDHKKYKKEALQYGIGANYWYCIMNGSVERSDSRAVSICCQYQDYIGGAHGFYYTTGMNYDTATGKKLFLHQIFKNPAQLQKILGRKLKKKYGADTFFNKNIWEYYGKKQKDGSWKVSEKSYNWTMSPDGVTFYFAPYALAPYASGELKVMIPYRQAKLFRTEYLALPTHYAQLLREDTYCDWKCDEKDLDHDGLLDRLSFTTITGKGDYYKKLRIKYKGKNFQKKLPPCYSIQPVLMHLSDGRNYLYVKCSMDNDYQTIVVFAFGENAVTKVGIVPGGFYEQNEEYDYFQSVPSDPEDFFLIARMDYLSTYNGITHCQVGADGMPASETPYYLVQSAPTLTSVRELEVSIVEDATCMETGKALIPKGEKFSLYRTDGKSYVDAKLSDGRICRLQVSLDEQEGGQLVNGQKLEDCFDGVVFTG